MAKAKIGKLPKPRLHARRLSAGGKSTYKGGKAPSLHIPRKLSIGGQAFGSPSQGTDMAFPTSDPDGL